jgi:hypothetical protein
LALHLGDSRMKKVSLLIAGKNYDISLDDEFAPAFEQDLRDLTMKYGNNDIKAFLSSFIEKCHENYKLKKELTQIEEIHFAIDEAIKDES